MPLEYSNEEQAICAVGLVKPRPGVFAEAIQQLLVVCTTTEVIICEISFVAKFKNIECSLIFLILSRRLHLKNGSSINVADQEMIAVLIHVNCTRF